MMEYLLVLVLPTVLINLAFIPGSFGSDFESVSAVINHYKDQIVKVEDLDTDARDDFVAYEKRKSPGIIRADFNGDGKEDVAILTKDTLLFFICRERCKQVRFVNYGGFAGFQYIVPIRKGQLIEEFGGFDNQQQTPSVRLKNTAVHLIFYGKASIAYYWDSHVNNFSDITTGD